MKNDFKINVLKLDQPSLLRELKKYKKELFLVSFNVKDGSEKNTSLIRKTRKNIAFLNGVLSKKLVSKTY